MKPRAIDLFAGCGGLTLGLKRAGFRVVGAVEIEPIAAETYRANHPEVFLWDSDIRKLTAPQILCALGLARGELDLLAGCPPCQGFSALPRLNGARKIRDDRNDLILDFLRLLRGLRPRAVMLENVPGISHDRRFRLLIQALARMGYAVNSEVQDASLYGVPQRRRRLILLAGKATLIPFAKPARTRRTVRWALQVVGRALSPRDPVHSLRETRSASVAERIRRTPKNGGSRGDLGAAWQLACHQRSSGFHDIYGRMAWDDVAPTITGGCCNPSKGRFLHPDEDRNITLREAALLQGFPVRYHFSLRRGKFHAAQMIGNALPPEFVRRHALKIKQFLTQTRS